MADVILKTHKRMAGVMIDVNHQKLVNSKPDQANSWELGAFRFFSLKNDAELKNLRKSVKKS